MITAGELADEILKEIRRDQYEGNTTESKALDRLTRAILALAICTRTSGGGRDAL